ncbi:MAG: RpiB/LacA/LacB family sugar-phosphate isomerase [Patescibacteria group bacterium]
MKIYLACDHAGFGLKNALIEQLTLLGNDIEDCGAFTLDPDDDYPDFVQPLTQKVLADAGSLGIVCAGSGQGEAMCANRVPGIRAAVFYGPLSAIEALDREGGHSENGYDIVRLARRHNDANILCIGSRFVSPPQADEAVRTFLTTPFTGDERHARRLGKF